MAASPASSAAASMPAGNSSITHKDFRQRKPSNVAVAFQQQQLAPPTLTIRPSTRPVPTEAKNGCLASAWREIHGANDWSGLVEPLDPLLREEVVRYGELVMACYKAFEADPSSNRYLKCKYGRHRLMNEVGLSAAGYEITRYIYATPGVSLLSSPAARAARWIGYVAVSSSSSSLRLGRRDIIVAFRGTVTAAEWAANIMSNLAPAGLDPLDPRPDVKVESGFLSLYTSADPTAARFGHGSCREQLLSEVSRLVNHHEGEGEATSITVAGHSMGSALAMLFGYDLAELGLSRAAPVAVYSFGGPRVGNAGFKGRMEELGVKVLRVVNVWDLVTKLPGLWKVGVPWSDADESERYEHVGVELALDFVELREFPTCVHDLGTYIQLLRVAAKGTAAARSRFPGWGWVDIVALRMVGDWVARSLTLCLVERMDYGKEKKKKEEKGKLD